MISNCITTEIGVRLCAEIGQPKSSKYYNSYYGGVLGGDAVRLPDANPTQKERPIGRFFKFFSAAT
jgi:hypothetical protein